MDRPVRSLLDIRIGTLVKAYAVYLAVGLVLFLVALLIVFSVWHNETKDTSPRSSSVLEWSGGAGDAIGEAQYGSVANGSALEAVRSRLGTPASIGPNPFDLVGGNGQQCLGYRSSASDETLYVLCFAGGRLVAKQTL